MNEKERKVTNHISELENRVCELEAERTLFLAENASLRQRVLEFETELEKLILNAKNSNDNISVSLVNIPDYLRIGDYYCGLVGSECFIDADGHYDVDDDDDDGNHLGKVDCTSCEHTMDSSQHNTSKQDTLIIVPKKCFKDNTIINSIFDLHTILESLRYWVVRSLPDTLISFALDEQTSQIFSYVAKEFWTDMPQLLQLHNVAEVGKDGVSKQIIHALEDEAPREVLLYLLEHHHPGISGDKKLSIDVAVTAARLGSLECLKYIVDHDLCDPSLDKCDEVCMAAAEEGHLDCLKLAHEHGYLWNYRICQQAAGKGHLDCLKFAHEHCCPWDESACSYAAATGHLDCLEYARENGCPWDVDTCSEAAYNGNLDCLEYAHENGCPWYGDTSWQAAATGQLDCLEYAHENGCPWDIRTCHQAAGFGQLDCFQYAHEHGCPWDELTSSCAAKNERLDCLKYAHEYGCPWDESTCSNAAASGHLDCLEYAHEHGCLWDELTCRRAAAKGHLDCLEYAHEHDCPWDNLTCSYAAVNGHIECLKYAEEHGCPTF